MPVFQQILCKTAHPDSADSAQGAVAALTGENIDIEKDL